MNVGAARATDIELTSDEIIRLFASGELLPAIVDRSLARFTPDLSEAEALCVELHNSGAIDILSLITPDSLAAITTHNFFGATHAIGRLIPHLASGAVAMMQSVECLVSLAGNDLAAGLHHGELLKWFEGHSDEAKAVVASARQGDALAIRCVTLALQAVKDADEARLMAKEFTDERRLASLIALSHIEELDRDGYQKSLALFGELLDESSNDSLQAHVLAASIWILEKSEDAMKPAAVDVIRRASMGGGKMTRWEAALSLIAHNV